MSSHSYGLIIIFLAGMSIGSFITWRLTRQSWVWHTQKTFISGTGVSVFEHIGIMSLNHSALLFNLLLSMQIKLKIQKQQCCGGKCLLCNDAGSSEPKDLVRHPVSSQRRKKVKTFLSIFRLQLLPVEFDFWQYSVREKWWRYLKHFECAGRVEKRYMTVRPFICERWRQRKCCTASIWGLAWYCRCSL